MAARRHAPDELNHVSYTLGPSRDGARLHDLDLIAVTPQMALAILDRLLRSLARHTGEPLAVEVVARSLSDIATALMPTAPNRQVAAALIAAARITTDAHAEAETRGREIARALHGEGEEQPRAASNHLDAIGDVLDGA